MAKSRAWWVCCMTKNVDSRQRYGFRMREESMEFVKGTDGKLPNGEAGLVNLVAQPALLKYGTGRGENYEKCEVVEKASVVAYV